MRGGGRGGYWWCSPIKYHLQCSSSGTHSLDIGLHREYRSLADLWAPAAGQCMQPARPSGRNGCITLRRHQHFLVIHFYSLIQNHTHIIITIKVLQLYDTCWNVRGIAVLYPEVDTYRSCGSGTKRDIMTMLENVRTTLEFLLQRVQGLLVVTESARWAAKWYYNAVERGRQEGAAERDIDFHGVLWST